MHHAKGSKVSFQRKAVTLLHHHDLVTSMTMSKSSALSAPFLTRPVGFRSVFSSLLSSSSLRPCSVSRLIVQNGHVQSSGENDSVAPPSVLVLLDDSHQAAERDATCTGRRPLGKLDVRVPESQPPRVLRKSFRCFTVHDLSGSSE